VDTGSETDSGGALAGREDGAMGGFLDIFEDLGFCCTGITEEEDVDIASDGVFPVDVFGDSAEEGECYGCFNVVVAVDTWSNGINDLTISCVTTEIVLFERCLVRG